jgi:hypothetical protein
MKSVQTLFLLCCFVFIVSCKENEPKIKLDGNGNEDFVSFYNTFLTDSTFQWTRVDFPMDRTASDFSSNADAWTPDNWIMQKPAPESNEIKQEFIPFGEMIIERLIIAEMYAVERRYIRREGKWYLMYYSDLQALSGTSN